MVAAGGLRHAVRENLAEGMNMDAKLVVVGGEAKSGEVKIKKLPAIVGRGDEADIRLRHPLVSRKHCEISESNGVLKVRDLGSLNGTFIASAKIKEAVLKPDDLITIGPVVFRAVYKGPAGADADDEFNFDLDDDADVSETQPMNLTKTASLRETVAADDIAFDDFDIEEPAAKGKVTAKADDDDDFGDLDFSLDDDDDKPAAKAKPAAAAASDDDEFGDLDFALDDEEEKPAKPAKSAGKPAAAKAVEADDELSDFSDLDFDVADDDVKPAAKAKAADDDEFADLLSVDDADFSIEMDDEPAPAKKPAKQDPPAKAPAKSAAKPAKADDEIDFSNIELDGDEEEMDDFLKDIGMEK
jgi:hypothetical protein